MKTIKVLLVLILAFASGSIKAQDLKALDDKYGFRDMKFGTDISEYQTMSLVESSKDSLTKYYIKTDEKLNIGKFDLKSINYGFYKGKLFFVYIKTKGYINSRGVLATLEELYGKGYQSNQYIDNYDWFGNLVVASYDENSITNDAKIMIDSKTIKKQMDEDKKKAVSNAKGDM